MQTTRSKLPKQRVRLDCGKYLVRTVTADDASDRWADWMADPEASHMLNAPARRMKKDDLKSYIESFDQRARVLLGIFEKGSWKHLGIIRADLDYERSQCLVFLLIGEPEYRNRRVTTDIMSACARNTFETLGFKTMAATALAHNQPVIHLMLKSGWTLDKTLPRHVKSHSGDTMLDVCVFTLTRDAWLAWEKTRRSEQTAQDVPASASPGAQAGKANSA
jgi:RimJ/RimL family protein N-acetyltransferase